jgi:hypothetical protein
VVKKSAGEDKSVYLGMSSEVHRALRHLAADRDVSVPRLLKNLINEFIATGTSAQRSVARDFPETEMSSQGPSSNDEGQVEADDRYNT